MSLEAESSGWRDDVDVQRTLRREDVLRIKVITMGDKGVGKSSILKRFCEDKFVNKYMETIGVDYGVKVRFCSTSIICELKVDEFTLTNG